MLFVTIEMASYLLLYFLDELNVRRPYSTAGTDVVSLFNLIIPSY